MAEKNVDTSGNVTANRPSTEGVVLESAEHVVRQAPDPVDKGGKIYKVLYPTDQFVMEGMPVVNTVGVRLTAEQAKNLLPVAETSGVQIVEVTE